jgi:hypothetical protein
MAGTLLRVEGVNFGATISDTDDLSTIRGASLAYLRLPELLFDALRREFPAIEPLWTGASVGVASIRDADDPETVRRRAYDLLYPSDPTAADPLAELRAVIPHLTLCVAAVEDKGNYLAESDALIAAVRSQQLRQPTVDIPLPGALQRPCRIDSIRPAIDEKWTGGGRRPMSASVGARRDYGRHMRQFVYKREIRPLLYDRLPERFADSFLELIKGAPENEPPFADLPLSLRQKMAVIYLDGNKFSRIRSTRFAGSAADDSRFSRHVKTRRRTLMEDLIGHLVALPDMTLVTANQHRKATKKFRFETLLWGGDEALFVMPGWRGIEALDVMLRSLDDPGWAIDGIPLTHAVGLVICDAKVPIRVIRELAKTLADDAKTTLPDDLQIQRTVAQFLILESFEPPDRLADFRRSLYGIAAPADFTFAPPAFGRVTEAVRALKADDGLPPSQLYGLLREARRDRLTDARAAPEQVAAFEQKTREICDRYAPELKNRLGELGGAGSHPVLRLARLAEIRDYVDPLPAIAS